MLWNNQLSVHSCFGGQKPLNCIKALNMDIDLLQLDMWLLLFAPLIIFMVLSILMETLVLFYFRLARFWNCLGISAAVNLATLVSAVLLVGLLAKLEVGSIDIPIGITFLFAFTLSVVLEFFILKLLIKNASGRQLLIPAVIMNLISGLILFAMYLKWSS